MIRFKLVLTTVNCVASKITHATYN